MLDARVAEFWDAFAAATGVSARYTAWAFGSDNDPATQTALGQLVLKGPKRATAGLLEEYQQEGEPLPAPGDYSVVLDGRGTPLCVIVTTAVEVRPFGEVDEEFAWIEGEGDRTLAWWKRAHLDFFAGIGVRVDDHSQMVLERFDLVWPVGAP